MIKLFTLVSLFLFQESVFDLSKELQLPSLFSDNMVLQRNSEVEFWGIASPVSDVYIKTPWDNYKTMSNSNGNWNVKINTPGITDSFQIEICSEIDCEVINNVVLGEVWLASGQSNMEMPLKGWLPNDPILNSEEEIINASKYPIRFFNVERTLSTEPQNQIKGSWDLNDYESAQYFSATAYFFARELNLALNVPIGIIHSSWSGTPVESWISNDGLIETGFFIETLDQLPELKRNLEVYKKWLQKFESFDSPFKNSEMEWTEKINNLWNNLPYNDLKFSKHSYSDKHWYEVQIPGDYIPTILDDKKIDFDGIIWLRKTFIVNDIDKEYFLSIGPVDDLEYTFINGVFIGSTLGPDSFLKKTYPIPKGILKKGENLISIRAIDTGGLSSILNPIVLKSEDQEISLEGVWKTFLFSELYQNEFYEINEDEIINRPNVIKLTSNTPTSLYNSMINPFIKFKIRGVIWYQGESNVGFHNEYEIIFKAMIKNWRLKWGYNFPFYFAQIAPYDYNNNKSPYIRNAQLNVSYLNNTGMAITLDIGNANNIHPSNKKEVGKRLADLAFENTYGLIDKLYTNKPVLIESKNNFIILKFDCIKGKIFYDESKKHELEISNDNINFFPADVKIDGCLLYLSSDLVSNPKYVRHAWSDIATGAIFNSQKIPISTFILSAK